MPALHVNESNWQAEVMESDVPVLVDFWADWCGPCKMIAPALDQLSEELAGKAKICKVSVDEAPGLAGQFGVRSIPNLLIFKGGTVQEQMVGAMSKSDLQSRLEAHI